MPTPAEFRYYTLSGENAVAGRARIQALHNETKQLGMKPLETVPMPDEFRELFRKFTGKTTIKDAVRSSQEESAKRREENSNFFSEGKV
jgi:phage I-like protein